MYLYLALKKTPLNFTFNLALRYNRLLGNSLLILYVVVLISSLDNPFDSHKKKFVPFYFKIFVGWLKY